MKGQPPKIPLNSDILRTDLIFDIGFLDFSNKKLVINGFTPSNERFSTNNTMQIKGRSFYLKVGGFYLKMQPFNHFLSVVCAGNAVNTEKMDCRFRYRVFHKQHYANER